MQFYPKSEESHSVLVKGEWESKTNSQHRSEGLLRWWKRSCST